MMPPMTQQDVAKKRDMENGEHIDFTNGSEPWTTLTLADGGEIKVRMVVQDVIRGADDPMTGRANYYVAHQAVVRVTKQPSREKEGRI